MRYRWTLTSVLIVLAASLFGDTASAGYMGCFTELPSGRALPNQLTARGATIESCVAAARAAGHAYAGLQYGGECHAGNLMGYILVPDTACNMFCTANSSEYCGAPNHNSIYSTYTPTVGPCAGNTSDVCGAPTPPPPGPPGYLGCYSDMVGNRTFPNLLSSLPAATMTIEACVAAAKTAGYSYAGVEYAGECYGGNVMAPTKIPQAQCNMACNGNSSEICGGPNALSVYGPLQ